jgi:hypothetical protein
VSVGINGVVKPETLEDIPAELDMEDVEALEQPTTKDEQPILANKIATASGKLIAAEEVAEGHISSAARKCVSRA